MKTDKKVINYFPGDFPKHKILCALSKKGSPRTLVIATEDKDEWFIDCIEIKTKSGEVMHVESIIEKDWKSRKDWYEISGWKEK